MKKLNQKGFTHHLLLLGMSVLVVGVVGFAGYKVYQSRSINAKAEVPVLLVDRSTIAASVAWQDLAGKDTPAAIVNGPVNYGYYASREVSTSTSVSTLSRLGKLIPNNLSNTFSHNYLYNGEMLFLDQKLSSSGGFPTLSRILTTKSNNATKIGVLKEFTGDANVSAVCAGNGYIAYSTYTKSGNESNNAIWVANYDMSQTRKAIDMATLKSQAVDGTPYHSISSISCGDNYAYFVDNGRAIYKVPFLTKRVSTSRIERSLVGSSTIRLADYTKIANVPTGVDPYFGGTIQFQRESQFIFRKGNSTSSTLQLLNIPTGVMKEIKPLVADTDPNYGCCGGYVSLSPDGLKIAYSHSTQGVKIWDIASARTEKTVMPNPKVSASINVYGWKPIQ